MSPRHTYHVVLPKRVDSEPKTEHDLPNVLYTDDRSPVSEQHHRTIGWLVPLTIVGGLVVGTGIALAHHFWLTRLDGRRVDVKEFGLSEEWIRTFGNAISYGVKIALCLSLSVSLTQVVWFHLRRSSYSIQQLDALFALPSPVKLVASFRVWHRILPALAITGALAAAPLISVKAPTALGIVPAGDQSMPITVPTVNIDGTDFIGSVVFEGGQYYSPTQKWLKVVQSALISSSAPTWDSPPECGSSCQYTVNYTAPALDCQLINSTSISEASTWSGDPQNDPEQQGTVGDEDTNPIPATAGTPLAYLENWDSSDEDDIYTYLYNFTHSLDVPQNDPFPDQGDYTMALAYLPFNFTTFLSTGSLDTPAAGAVCTFYNATYEASVEFSNNGQQSRTTIVGYNSPLQLNITSVGFNLTYNNNNTSILPPDPRIPALNYLSIANAFAQALAGTIDVWSDESSSGSSLTFSYNGTNAGLTTLFDIDETQMTFNSSTPDLGQGLTDLLGNVTLGFMSMNTGTTLTAATVTLPYNVWRYTPHILLAVYGTAIAVTLACAVVGLVCLVHNGRPGTMDFSQMVATTRNPSLDGLFEKQAVSEDVDRTRLRYRDQIVDGNLSAGFVVDAYRPMQEDLVF